MRPGRQCACCSTARFHTYRAWRAVVPQHRLLGGRGKQAIPGHTNTLAISADIFGGGDAAFPLRPEGRGLHAAILMTERFTDGGEAQAGDSRAVRRERRDGERDDRDRPGRGRVTPATLPRRGGACAGPSGRGRAGSETEDVVRTVVYLAPGAAGSRPRTPTATCSPRAWNWPGQDHALLAGLTGTASWSRLRPRRWRWRKRSRAGSGRGQQRPELRRAARAGRGGERAGFDQLWVSNDCSCAPRRAGRGAGRAHRPDRPRHRGHEPVRGARQRAGHGRDVQEVSGGRFRLGSGPGRQFLGWAGIARTRPLATTPTARPCAGAVGHRDVDVSRCRAGSGRRACSSSACRGRCRSTSARWARDVEMAGRHADGVLPLLYPPERYAAVRSRSWRARRRRPAGVRSTCRPVLGVAIRRPGRCPGRAGRERPTTCRRSRRRLASA